VSGARRRRREGRDDREGGYLSELRDQLAERGLRLTKRLGQHFLIDPNLNGAIARVGAAGAGVVLEVGPGSGSLTEGLLASGAEVVAVEIDSGLVAFLRERFADAGRLALVHADALDGGRPSGPLCEAVAAALVRRGCPTFRLVANLPYSIASTFLIALAGSNLPWAGGAVVLQREVGERLEARAGTREYGAASVAWQLLATGRIERTIPRSVFWPMPDVESALLEIAPRADAAAGLRARVDEFGEFMKAVFSQRRKILRSALARALNAVAPDTCDARARIDAALAEFGIAPDARAEELAPATFAAVWERLAGA
jgi:16S rRNA (adenine1518-N6/adenine1519-N6)-dimethyltransferase